MDTNKPSPIWRTIRAPVIVSLVILATRLTGEVLEIDSPWFAREAGGGGSLLGMSWLIPVFGFLFGWKLTTERHAPDRPGLALILNLLGLALLVGGLIGAVQMLDPDVLGPALGALGVVTALFAWRAWPELAKRLLVYGLIVRAAVIAITLVVFPMQLGTHFELVAPSMADLPRDAQLVGLCMAQVAFWIPGTALAGGIAGCIASMIRGRRSDDARDA
jgi:hypothetical protein